MEIPTQSDSFIQWAHEGGACVGFKARLPAQSDIQRVWGTIKLLLLQSNDWRCSIVSQCMIIDDYNPVV